MFLLNLALPTLADIEFVGDVADFCIFRVFEDVDKYFEAARLDVALVDVFYKSGFDAKEA